MRLHKIWALHSLSSLGVFKGVSMGIMRGVIFAFAIAGATESLAGYKDGLRAFLKKDYEAARQNWQPLAEKGNPEAQTAMGILSECACGRAPDMATAISWYRKAAKGGDARAHFYLGNLYLEGKGLARDASAAVRHYEISAKSGHKEAPNNLGTLYGRGLGVPQDSVVALMWFLVAEKAGSPRAKGNIQLEMARLSRDEQNLAKDLFRSCLRSRFKKCGR